MQMMVTVLALALLVTLGAIGGAAAAASGLPEPTIPQSFGMQIKPDCSSPEDLAQIRELGVRFIRRGFYWKNVEIENGKYDFTEYDTILDEADRLGLRVVGCLYGNPNNPIHEDNGLGGIQTEQGRKGFAAFAAACAERYKGRGVFWEVWNEPNVRTFWRKNGTHNSKEFAEEYVALVKEVVPAMRALDPDCFVMAGSVSCFWDPSFSWTNDCFAAGIYGSGISAWSVHPYGLKTPEEFTAGYERMRGIMAKYGVPADFPMLNSERGFAVKKTKSWEGNPENEGWAGGPEGKAMTYQAWHIVRQYLIDQMNGIGLTVWYEWAGKEFAIANDELRRPAYHACKTLIDQLTGYRFAERLKTASELDYLLLFRNPAGSEILVAWTAPPAGKAPDQTRDHEVMLPVQATGTLTGVDLFGKPEQIEIVDGNIRLRLTGAPQYVKLK